MSWLSSNWKKILMIIAIIIVAIACFYLAAAILVAAGAISVATASAITFGLIASTAGVWGAASVLALIAVGLIAVGTALSPEGKDKVIETITNAAADAGDAAGSSVSEFLDQAADPLLPSPEKTFVYILLGGALYLYLTRNKSSNSSQDDPIPRLQPSSSTGDLTL